MDVVPVAKVRKVLMDLVIALAISEVELNPHMDLQKTIDQYIVYLNKELAYRKAHTYASDIYYMLHRIRYNKYTWHGYPKHFFIDFTGADND
ncbi:MAG: hypothetical protein LBS60_08795 [Deltaproteobacteria bacterium]|jgi:hypothetical protein|nr:hypothetical protein [Deltaproteobacteria bacterium]